MGDLIFKPASGGDLILQDEGGSPALTVDTSGNTQLHGKLESSSNAYAFATSGELNSLGYLDRVFFGSSYYLSSADTIASGAYTYVDATWAKAPAGVNGTTTGSTDADPMGKFSSGIWTPGVAGYYLCTYSVYIGGIDDGEQMITFLAKNWSSGGAVAGLAVGHSRQFASATNQVLGASGSGIFALGTTDHVKLVVYQTSGDSQEAYDGATTIGFYYLGKNAI
jgi:hypothetical protein